MKWYKKSAFRTEILKKAGWPLKKSGWFKSPGWDWLSTETLCSRKTHGSSKSIEWNRMLTCRSQKLDFESRLIFQRQKELAYRVPPHCRIAAIFLILTYSWNEVATDPTGRTLGLSAWLEVRPIGKSAACSTIKSFTVSSTRSSSETLS